MRKIWFVLIAVVLSCQSPSMDFKITHQQILKDVPSASGIVKHQDHFYLIGDDTPFLFRLNGELDTVAHFPVYTTSGNFEDRRIVKKDKPDFEALEMISENEIIAFGSGSKSPERDVFIRILMNDALSVKEFSLTGFYDSLRKMDVLSDSELNIEAAAYHRDFLYLFNRRKNVIFRIRYSHLLNHIEGKLSLPEIAFSEYELPQIKGIGAGFSGAAVTTAGKLIVTASVEDTGNAYDDGEVLGSFIGIVSLQPDKNPGPIEWMEIKNAGEVLKVESVTVDKEISENELNVLLVTDSDGGESLILKGNLKW